MRDDDVRAAMFAALDVLRARCGPDVPWDELRAGFNFRGGRVPFMSPSFGIYRWLTRSRSRSPTSSAPGRAGTGRSTPRSWPRTGPAERRVLVTFGKMRGPYDEREAVPIDDEIERRHVVREVRARIHQARFRGAVIPAYADRCAICRLREVRLLDAAHIVADADERGEPRVANGLSLCTIHHRAYDQDLVGVAPDHRVHVSRTLLDDDDGPMLDLLKGFHGRLIEVPAQRRLRPDPDRLQARFTRFREVGRP